MGAPGEGEAARGKAPRSLGPSSWLGPPSSFWRRGGLHPPGPLTPPWPAPGPPLRAALSQLGATLRMPPGKAGRHLLSEVLACMGLFHMHIPQSYCYFPHVQMSKLRHRS